MQLGMTGLGRMGAEMVRRLIGGGHECVVFATSLKAVSELTDARRSVLLPNRLDSRARGRYSPDCPVQRVPRTHGRRASP